MGRKRQMFPKRKPGERMPWITVAKTDGYTVADADMVLALQLASIAEQRGRDRPEEAFISRWGPNLAKDLTRAKRKGLVHWIYRRTKTVNGQRTTFIAGISLTPKGAKILSTAGGTVYLSPRGARA